MTTIPWLICGFALLGLSGLLETLGDAGATPGDRLPYYLPALAALMGASFCFFRGVQSGIAEIMGKKSAKPIAASGRSAPRPARRIADMAEDMPETDFDADAVFARYMEKRAAQSPEPTAAAPATAAGATQNPQPSEARPAFGRKVI